MFVTGSWSRPDVTAGDPSMTERHMDVWGKINDF